MPIKRMSMRVPVGVAVTSVSLCALFWLCSGIYLYWNNARLVNFLAAWIPFVLSILLAFVPEHKMSRTKKVVWRSSVIAVGFIWSIVLWHQQIITEQIAKEDQEKIVTTAVAKSNQHSDQQIGAVRSDVQGVKTDVQGVKNNLTQINDSISKSTSTLTDNIGKINKPQPPELARLQFSFLVGEVPYDDFPIVKRSVSQDKDGNVAVDVTFRNTSGTTAEAVDVWIYVCDICSFAAEPPGFDKPKGEQENARHMKVAILNPGAGSEKITILVKPQRVLSLFDVGFIYSCKACGKMQEIQKLMVFVLPTP